MPLHRLFLAATATLLPLSAAADSAISATGASRGFGFEVSTLDRSLEIVGDPVSARGVMGGVYAFIQQGAAFRAEGRALVGSLDVESDALAREESSPTNLLNGRATWGTEIGSGQRLYVGGGVEYVTIDEPLENGDYTAWTAYVPFGMAQYADFSAGWRVLVTVEARFLVTGNEELEDANALGDADADLDRDSGFGLSLSAQFRNEAAGIHIEPFITYDEPSDTETKTISGTRTSVDDIENGTAGVRVSWTF